MYETEQAEFRYPDRKRFAERLLRNGPRAVAEFEKAQQLWAQRPVMVPAAVSAAARTHPLGRPDEQPGPQPRDRDLGEPGREGSKPRHRN